MFIIVAKYLFPKGFVGLAFFPFVFVKYRLNKENKVFINHERIHLRQQVELLIIPFFIWYFIEFFLRWMHYKNLDLAYRNICFEREAYANEKNLDYLKRRSLWEFLRFTITDC